MPDRGGYAPAQAGHGHPRRSGCGGKKGLIEQAYTLGAQLGLSVWCEDEAGPFQAVPRAGVSMAAKRATGPGNGTNTSAAGTTKILTLFHPASGQGAAATGGLAAPIQPCTRGCASA